jgi:hypothetical protein
MNKIDWRNPRIICWFSCGAASAVAAKLTIENMENYPIQVICCDTRVNEHPDNYRFAEEVERWIGQPIIFMRNEDYETVDDVFNRHRYMSGIAGANCLGCVKAGSPWYWDKTRQLFPEVFARRCEQSRRLGVRLVKLYGRRIFLDELPPGPFPKRGAIEENVSCGPECGQSGEQQ